MGSELAPGVPARPRRPSLASVRSSPSPQCDAARSRPAKFQSRRGVSSCKRGGPTREDSDHRAFRRGSHVGRAGGGCAGRAEHDLWRAASRRKETSRGRRAPRSTAGDASQGGGLSGRVRLRACGPERFRSGLHPVPAIWRRRWWWRRVDVVRAPPRRHMIPTPGAMGFQPLKLLFEHDLFGKPAAHFSGSCSVPPSKRHCCGAPRRSAATVLRESRPGGFPVR